MASSMRPDPAPPTPPEEGGPLFAGLVFLVRLMTLVAVAATFATALGLLGYASLQTWRFGQALLALPRPAEAEVMLKAIKIVDLFLLATVVQVVSLGLYQLYFGARAGLPAWLRVGSLDDLKAKLVTVTITLLGVFFLGEALAWTGGTEIMALGLGIGAAVSALSLFLAIVRTPKPEKD